MQFYLTQACPTMLALVLPTQACPTMQAEDNHPIMKTLTFLEPEGSLIRVFFVSGLCAMTVA